MAFKLTPAQATALRKIAADGPTIGVKGRTLAALRSRSLIKYDDLLDVQITPTGLSLLAELERAERAAQESAERLSRPVPAQIGEPAAARPLVLDTDMGNGCECDQDGCKVCFPEPAVPQAWIDQLVTLLNAGVKVTLVDTDWWVVNTTGVPFGLNPERVQIVVPEAIRRGIVQVLPPTPGQGVIRLALKRN